MVGCWRGYLVCCEMQIVCMPLPLTVSCFQKSRLFTFLEKEPLNGVSMCFPAEPWLASSQLAFFCSQFFGNGSFKDSRHCRGCLQARCPSHHPTSGVWQCSAPNQWPGLTLSTRTTKLLLKVVSGSCFFHSSTGLQKTHASIL